MNIVITNWFYSVNGVHYFFLTQREALDSLLNEHTKVYFSCVNPMTYVQKCTKQFNLKVFG